MASGPRNFTTNHYRGKSLDQHFEDIRWYDAVRYDEIVEGIDLLYHQAEQGRVEYTFVMAPGAETDTIKLQVHGAQQLEIGDEGQLIAHRSEGQWIQQPPITYQWNDSGTRDPVDSWFEVHDDLTYSFGVGDYDPNRPLEIDPGDLLGIDDHGRRGRRTRSKPSRRMRSATRGQLDLLGRANFQNAEEQTELVGESDVFVLQQDPFGTILGATFVGGDDVDVGEGIVRDAAGNIYVAGWTRSTDFPTQNAEQDTLAGLNDSFVLSLDHDLKLRWSTYWGGERFDLANDVCHRLGGHSHSLPATRVPVIFHCLEQRVTSAIRRTLSCYGRQPADGSTSRCGLEVRVRIEATPLP